MEGDPHGSAHASFSGLHPVDRHGRRDPLFFLLHANVDRLWAKWQWIHKRHEPDPAHGRSPTRSANRVGHRLADTMWPWNGVTGGAATRRPRRAARSPRRRRRRRPGRSRGSRAMIDYQAVAGAAPLGFAYDDVPFEV